MSLNKMPTARNLPGALVLDGVELQPTLYEEWDYEGRLTMNVIAMVSAQDSEIIRKRLKDHSPFPVLRQGIDDGPAMMAFGACAFSKHPEGVKYSLFLREEGGSIPPIRAYQFVEARRHDMIAYRAGFSEELATLLVEKGVITAGELERVKDRAVAGIADRMLDWQEVPDVDDLAR